MKKLILVINGHGGCGKDTLCEMVGRHYQTRNVSAITPIKQAAELLGWSGGKEDIDRKFLSDLKYLSMFYNDYPTQYLLKECFEFLKSSEEVMFVHIREPEQIRHFKNQVKTNMFYDVKTLLVRSSWTEDRSYGNPSDDNVEKYEYDYTYLNERRDPELLEAHFLEFFEKTIARVRKPKRPAE